MANETTEDKVKELEEEVFRLKIDVAAKDKGLEEEKKEIVDYTWQRSCLLMNL